MLLCLSWHIGFPLSGPLIILSLIIVHNICFHFWIDSSHPLLNFLSLPHYHFSNTHPKCWSLKIGSIWKDISWVYGWFPSFSFYGFLGLFSLHMDGCSVWYFSWKWGWSIRQRFHGAQGLVSWTWIFSAWTLLNSISSTDWSAHSTTRQLILQDNKISDKMNKGD